MKPSIPLSKKLIPAWRDGLHAVQLELVSAILDEKDVLYCTATGDGKSAAFSVPTFLLSEYNKYPEAYIAGLPTRKRPIGVVVTPTKGLADNIVRLFINSRRSAHDFTVRELTLAKRQRQATRAFDDDDSGPSISSNSNTERAEETIEEPPEQYLEKSLGHKRQALEEMANTAKRRRAPRTAQPSVS